MKLFYCFAVENEKQYNILRDWKSISPNPNHFRMCIAREKWIELQHFSALNAAIYFNRETGKYTDPAFQPINPDGIIVGRVDNEAYLRMMRVSKNLITSPEDFEKIEYWYNFVPREYVGRDFEITSPKKLAEVGFDNAVKKWLNARGEFFIKSVNKGFSYTGSLEGFYDFGVAYSLETGSEDKLIMFQEHLQLKEDDEDTLEYRCFYLDGKLLSISRYEDYKSLPVPKEVHDLATRYEKEIVGTYLPTTVVIDIFDTDRGLVFGEANALPCSGRYHDNKCELFPTDI
jgi:hypothetical protein